MQQFAIGVSTEIGAILYVRAESGNEAWEKAQAWLLTEEDTDDVYLDEDRFLEDAWKLDSIQPTGN